MDRTSRRILMLVVEVAALGYFFYKFRNSITLEGFQWSTVGESLRNANLGLLALVTIYGCFAIRAVRWNWLSRSFGAPKFGERSLLPSSGQVIGAGNSSAPLSLPLLRRGKPSSG
jgi:hypothetical protein